MTVEVVERLITSVGFPIVMCIVLIYYIVKISSLQAEELKELRKAINDNTNALNQVQTVIKIVTKNE